MTSFETMAVWLFGIYCASVTVCSVVRSLTVRSTVAAVVKAKRATREDVR